MQTIEIEKAMMIERERHETMSDPAFIAWVREFNVSQSYKSTLVDNNARELQMNYDSQKYLNFIR